jgi:hypothetical protein
LHIPFSQVISNYFNKIKDQFHRQDLDEAFISLNSWAEDRPAIAVAQPPECSFP